MKIRLLILFRVRDPLSAENYIWCVEASQILKSLRRCDRLL